MGLAIDLGQRGIPTCVIERHPDPQPIPKGQNLTQRSVDHARAWGCDDALLAAHPLPKGAGIGGMTAYGTLLSDYTYDWLNRGNAKDYYLSPNARLPQYVTERVLRDRAAALPAIDIRYGWTGTKVTQSDDNATLEITHGSDVDRVTARYIVGCDGSASAVRETAEIAETRQDHNRRMALIVFQSSHLHDLLERHPGKAFYNVLHPDYDGYWLFFGRVDHGHSWFFHAPVPIDTTQDSLDFPALLHRAVGQQFDLDIDYIGFWDLRVATAATYRKKRVFVAGDAAHSHPPYGGYGINTGFEDARNLGWKLGADIQGWGGSELLDSYDAERRPVFASTAQDFIERFIEDDREFLRAYAPSKDRDAFEDAWYKRNLDAAEVLAFEPNFEGSPVVPGSTGTPSAQGEHSFRARIGHVLSPPGADGKEVGTLCDEGFAIFAQNTDDAAPFVAAATQLGVPLRLRQARPEWCDIWGHRIILVRPDGYVVFAGDAANDAEATLATAIGHAAKGPQ